MDRLLPIRPYQCPDHSLLTKTEEIVIPDLRPRIVSLLDISQSVTPVQNKIFGMMHIQRKSSILVETFSQQGQA